MLRNQSCSKNIEFAEEVKNSINFVLEGFEKQKQRINNQPGSDVIESDLGMSVIRSQVMATDNDTEPEEQLCENIRK